MASEQKLSMVLFSGTDDKLLGATHLIAGATALGREVDVFLQFWAVDAFRHDHIQKDHGVTVDAGPEGPEMLQRYGELHWVETLHQAKEAGTVRITACTRCMDAMGLGMEDMDELVDEMEGVTSFLARATGQLVDV